MERNKSCSIYSTPWSRTVRVYSTPGVDLERNKCYSGVDPRLILTVFSSLIFSRSRDREMIKPTRFHFYNEVNVKSVLGLLRNSAYSVPGLLQEWSRPALFYFTEWNMLQDLFRSIGVEVSHATSVYSNV